MVERRASKGLFDRPVDVFPVAVKKVLPGEGVGRPFAGPLPVEVTASLIPECVNPDECRMMVLSPTSGRTLTERASHDRVVWGGPREADVYGSRDQKGVRHGEPDLMFYQDGERIEVYGLMQSRYLERAEIMSSLFRGLGLPTERLAKVCFIDETYIDDKTTDGPLKIGVDEWRRQNLERLRKKYSRRSKLAKRTEEFVRTVNFAVVERDLQVGERLIDYVRCQDELDFTRLSGRVLRWLNAALATRESGLISGTEKPSRFDPESEEDIRRYLGEWLPEQMGTYLGRVHRHGLALCYAHTQNWSAVGTFYDLDSVTGEREILRDEVPTKGDYDNDSRYVWSVFDQLFANKNGGYTTRKFGDLFLPAKAAFFKAYSLERYGEVIRPDYDCCCVKSEDRKGFFCSVSPKEWVRINHLMGFELTKSERREMWRKFFKRELRVW